MDELRNLNRQIKDLVDGLKYQFEKLASNIGGHINDAMTDEMALVKDQVLEGFDTVKTGAVGIYRFFVKSFTFEKGMMKETKKHTKLMQETIDTIEDTATDAYLKKQTAMMTLTTKFAKRDEIRKRKMIGAKPKGMWDYLMDFLGIPFMIAGALVGAIVGTIMAPFRLIYAAFKQLRFFEVLGGILKLIPGVSKLFGWVGKLFTGIWETIKMVEKIPIIGKLISTIGRSFASGFMKGFTKLFWPIQIIMSIFDFAEGWQKTEGAVWEKALGGIRNAFMKFIELPVKLAEGAWNWVAKEFGFEGVATGTFMKNMGKGFDWITKELPTLIWDWLVSGVKAIWAGAKDVWKYMSDRDFDFTKIAKDILSSIFSPIAAWISEKWKKTLDFITPKDALNSDEGRAVMRQMRETHENALRQRSLGDLRRQVIESSGMGKAELDRIEKENKTDDEKKDAMIKLLADIKEGIRDGGRTQQTQVNTMGGGGSEGSIPSSSGPEKIAGMNNSFGLVRGLY